MPKEEASEAMVSLPLAATPTRWNSRKVQAAGQRRAEKPACGQASLEFPALLTHSNSFPYRVKMEAGLLLLAAKSSPIGISFSRYITIPGALTSPRCFLRRCYF